MDSNKKEKEDLMKQIAEYIKVHKLMANLLRLIFFIILACLYLNISQIDLGHGLEPIFYHTADGTFHFERILSLENIFHSPVDFKYFNHNGNMTSLFYPWLTAYPMYLLLCITKTYMGAYYLFWILMTFLTLEITYQVMRKISHNEFMAIVSSIVYTFSISRTINISERFAFGEGLAMTFLPIVLLGVYQIFYSDDNKIHWYSLALGMTLIAYTHILSLVMAVILVAFFFIAALIHRKITWTKFLALVKAGVVSLFMTAGVFIPMLQMYLNVKINPPLQWDLANTALSLKESLDRTLSNLLTSKDTLGIVLLVLFIISLIAILKVKSVFIKDCVVGSILFILLTSTVMPWKLLQPILGQIQFPWRFFVIATLLVSFAGTYTIFSLVKKIEFKIPVAILIILAAFFFNYFAIVNSSNIAEAKGQDWIYADMSTTYWNGIDDYTPEISENDANDRNLIKSNKVKINGTDWIDPEIQTTADKITFTIDLNEKAENKIILPVYVYPGEKVTWQGKEISAKAAYNGATIVDAKQGLNTYTIEYKYTKTAIVSKIISLVSMIIFAFVWSVNCLKEKKGRINEE